MRIMVVEDLAIMRRVIVNCLRNIGIDDIVEATDGIDAFSKIQKDNIDFLITDWNMPSMNGKDLVKMLRKDKQHKDIPIMVITAKGNTEAVFEVSKAKVNDFIVKPITPESLQKKINDILGNLGKPGI